MQKLYHVSQANILELHLIVTYNQQTAYYMSGRLGFPSDQITGCNQEITA